MLTQRRSIAEETLTTGEPTSHPRASKGRLNLMVTTVLAFALATSAQEPPVPKPWSLSPSGALAWGSSLYTPVGARIPGTPDAIRSAHAAGVQSVLIELPATGEGWGEALTALRETGQTFAIAIVSAAPAAEGEIFNIGSQEEVTIRQLADAGTAVLMISSELPEIIGMSDRIVVMWDGRISGELPAGAGEEEIMLLATGHQDGAGSTPAPLNGKER